MGMLCNVKKYWKESSLFIMTLKASGKCIMQMHSR